jgi:hypothetical protein
MGAPARPGVPFSRPYTGMDGIAPGIKGGLQQWIIEARRSSNNALWNNGAYGVREMRGKKDMSVHATGRAVDLSYRKRAHHPNNPSGRAATLDWLDRVITHANTLGIEMLIDYFPEPHGRAWRCDRQDWLVYKTKTVSGAPGGDWYHVEISPMMAQNASTVRKAWASIFPEIPR